MRTSLIFFGTHDFAAVILEALIASPLFSVQLVVTQPDRPVGREQHVQKPAVKNVAEVNHISVAQPSSLSHFEIPANTAFDLGVTAQYGGLIPQHILSLPRHGMLNVHTSLLPKYRGASPIQTAILHGEKETGITIMRMDEGLDTGPILVQESLSILPDDTYETLEKKLAQLGAQLLPTVIPRFLSGEITPTPQDNKEATFCKKITREDGKVDWTKSSQEIYNQFRAFTPWPGIWTTWNGKRLKLLSIRPSSERTPSGRVMAKNDTLLIGCGDASIEVTLLQLEGKKPMDVKTFLLGHASINGSALE